MLKRLQQLFTPKLQQLFTPKLTDEEKEILRNKIQSNADIAMKRDQWIRNKKAEAQSSITSAKDEKTKHVLKKSFEKEIKEYVGSSLLQNEDSAILSLRNAFIKYKEQGVFNGSTQKFESKLRNNINFLLENAKRKDLRIPSHPQLIIKPPYPDQTNRKGIIQKQVSCRNLFEIKSPSFTSPSSLSPLSASSARSPEALLSPPDSSAFSVHQFEEEPIKSQKDSEERSDCDVMEQSSGRVVIHQRR